MIKSLAISLQEKQLIDIMPKLFLLENDPDIAFAVDMYLSQKGYKVFSFTLTVSLIEALGDIRPDVILLDYYALKIDDYKLLPRILKTGYGYPHKVFLFSTSELSVSVLDESWADGLIAKPFDLEELSRVIDAALP